MTFDLRGGKNSEIVDMNFYQYLSKKYAVARDADDSDVPIENCRAKGGPANCSVHRPELKNEIAKTDDLDGEADTEAMDAAYADAVKRGDKDAALEMVREAAARAMPNTKVVDEDGLPMVVFHGSKNKFTEFDTSKRDENRFHQLGSERGFWFTSNYRGAERYGKAGKVNTPMDWDSLLKGTAFNDKEDFDRFGAYLFSINTPQTDKVFFTKRDAYFDINSKINKQKDADRLASTSNVYSVFLNIENPQEINGEFIGVGVERDAFLDSASRLGDGAIIYNADMGGAIGDEYIAFSPSQIKSADITYDDAGNIIPLSQRFKKDNPDIRY